MGKIASPLTLNGVGPRNGIPSGPNGFKFDVGMQNSHSYYAAHQHPPLYDNGNQNRKRFNSDQIIH